MDTVLIAAKVVLVAVMVVNFLRLLREEIADNRRRLAEGRFWQRALPEGARRRVGRYLAYAAAAGAGALVIEIAR